MNIEIEHRVRLQHLRRGRGEDRRGIGVAEAEREAVEAAGVCVPEVEARGSVPGEEVAGNGGGGGACGGGEERVFGEWKPFEFVFGRAARAWFRARV